MNYKLNNQEKSANDVGTVSSIAILKPPYLFAPLHAPPLIIQYKPWSTVLEFKAVSPAYQIKVNNNHRISSDFNLNLPVLSIKNLSSFY